MAGQLLEKEEYVEQAHFFKILAERMRTQGTSQELLAALREELLSTTRLPMAVEFLASELRHSGEMAPAMARLGHYFTPFQTFVIREAEREEGRFDLYVGLEVLQREAAYRAGEPTPQGVFLYQFETLCRNRLGYQPGLEAMAQDPIFDANWQRWIDRVRSQIGIIDLADLLFVHSAYYFVARPEDDEPPADHVVLFGEKEGRIALANRRRDPLLMFAALQRHLNYPAVPRPQAGDPTQNLVPNLARRIERLETRLKLLEEEQRGGLDITKFYQGMPPRQRPPDAGPGA